MRNKLIVCILSLMGICSSGFAQVNDAGQWTTLTLERKFTQSYAMYLTQELRFNQNISELGVFFTELGAEYKINNLIKISAAYRFVNSRRLDGTYNGHSRYYTDITIKKKFKPVILIYRLRYQSQLLNFVEQSQKTIPTTNIRNKFIVKLDLHKSYTPYIAAELFYQLNDNIRKEFDRVRYYVGFDYEINKKNEVGLYYLLQKEFNVVNPNSDYVIGLTYTYLWY